MRALAVIEQQEKLKKDIEIKNLKKALASEKAYNKMMQENENFKETTKKKVEEKQQKFLDRWKDRSINALKSQNPEFEGRRSSLGW